MKPICQICKKEMNLIATNHLRTHGYTSDTYKKAFPGYATISDELSMKFSAHATSMNNSRDYTGHGEKISKTKKLICSDPNWVSPLLGIPRSEESKRKMSETKKAKYKSGETIHHMKGKTHSDETKQKIRESTKGYVLTTDQKQKWIISMKEIRNRPGYVGSMLGKTHSIESRAKISQSSINSYDDIRAIMEEKGRWIPLSRKSEFLKYEMKVTNETRKNLKYIPNYDSSKQGLCKIGTDNHQVDHMYSVIDGFKNNVDPKILGHFKNLRFIHWKQNLSKWNKSHISLDELYKIIQ